MRKSKNLPKTKNEPMFPQKFIALLADEVAETVARRLPHLIPRPQRKSKGQIKIKRIENAIFLDTSAIIDGRIFDVINIGLLTNVMVVLESILLELKHIADSQDAVKRERGRKGLERLESLKKRKGSRVLILSENEEKKFSNDKTREVDEKLIKIARFYHGKIVTCDYNLEKKASIQNVTAVNINALANSLKVTAVPGETLHIGVLHQGKDVTQGVGYLDDGTMIVIENASEDLGRAINVVVTRVIQTQTGRILFAKKI